MMNFVRIIVAFLMSFFVVSLMILFSALPINFAFGKHVLLEYNLLRLLLLIAFAYVFSLYIFRLLHIKGLGEGIVRLLILLIVVAEGVFSFVPKSHLAPTLSTKVWYSYYWKPINVKGYRDIENECYNTDKLKVAFCGDSFTAGHGINKISDRYADLVREALGSSETCFVNISLSGLNTKGHFEQLSNQEELSDVLVYQYYINDILDAAQELNYSYQPTSQGIFQGIVVNNSYLLSYIKYSMTSEVFEPNFKKFLSDMYQNEEVLNEHISQLEKIIDLYKDKRIIFILFPDLEDVEGSEAQLQSIEKVLAKQQIEYINLSNLVKGMDKSERTVNATDSHPSVLLNYKVAELIIELLQK
jgi:hypothetical protein